MMKKDISISTDLWINLSGYLMSFRESGGASGSRAHPTFSARPAGLRRFCVYRWYTFPPLSAIKKEISIPKGIPDNENV
ncbi:MAG TPA: hypothetical protein VL442_05050 [Mucilaginibacter sp.]|nr:hypothetical protein [Mucilaginibacter sp.]